MSPRATRAAGATHPSTSRSYCATDDTDAVTARFTQLPQIVALLEADERHAVGLDRRGHPRRARPRLAAAGRDRAAPRHRVARLRRRARAAPRCRHRARGLQAAGHFLAPAGAPGGPVRRRAPGARRARPDPGRPAQRHDVVRRPRERRGDGLGGAGARVRVPRHPRPHPGRRRGHRPHPGRRPPAGRGDRHWRTRRSLRSACCEASSATSSRRPPRPSRRRPRRARLGPGERPRRPAHAAHGDDQAGRGGAAQPVRPLPQPPEGPRINRRPENELDLDRIFAIALEHAHRPRGQRPSRPARSQRRARPAGAGGRRQDRSARPTPTRPRDSATWSTRSPPPAGAGRDHAMSSTPVRSRSCVEADATQNRRSTPSNPHFPRMPQPRRRATVVIARRAWPRGYGLGLALA